MGYGDLSQGLRDKIWQKRAIQNPASVVAFRPEIINEGEKAQWDEIAPHLDVAFNMWVDNEYEENYRNGMSMTQLRNNRNAFKNGINNPEYRYQITNQEYLKNNLTEPQLLFLKTIIDRAIGESKYLSEAKLPHIYDLDDTAYVSWSSDEDEEGNPVRGLDNQNMFRMFNDQGNLQENG